MNGKSKRLLDRIEAVLRRRPGLYGGMGLPELVYALQVHPSDISWVITNHGRTVGIRQNATGHYTIDVRRIFA